MEVYVDIIVTHNNILTCWFLAIDACASAPCIRGSCEDIGDDYECCCDHGWTGRNCDTGTNTVLVVLIR